MSVLIKHDFGTLNDHDNANRSNAHKGSKLKKLKTDVACVHFLGKKYKTPCIVKFKWHLQNKRRDIDNVYAMKKYILDGMVKAQAIPNDNMKHVTDVKDSYVMSDFWGCEVEVVEGDD